MVSDTKVSFYYPDGHPDAQRTRRTYFEALPKIVLLSPDLMVGVTGDNPHQVIADVVAHHTASVENVLDRLATMTSAGFVVAALHPARLWRIDGDKIDDRTPVGR